MSFRLFLLGLPMCAFGARGDLVSFSKKAHIGASEHKALCNSFSIKCEKAKDCDVYTYKYETISVDNAPATASGVIIIPEGMQTKSILAYLHGTVSDKEGAPSNLGYHLQLPLSVFAQGNYLIVIPDYLGIGQSSSVYHPFCHAKSLASCSYDAVLAAKTLFSKISIKDNGKLFISGYSEGGMAAMALHQYVETNPFNDLNLKASCPMSGPYDLSASLSFALNSTSPRMNTYISYVISSYNLIYPGTIPAFNQVFSKEINYMIPLLFDGCHPFWTINGILNRVQPLLNPEFIKSTLAKGSAFFQKLQENDTYKFTPKIRMHLIGLENDSEVGYLNSVNAYNYMKKNKCPISLENVSSELDHMQGSSLCHMQALKFFQELD